MGRWGGLAHSDVRDEGFPVWAAGSLVTPISDEGRGTIQSERRDRRTENFLTMTPRRSVHPLERRSSDRAFGAHELVQLGRELGDVAP